MTHRTAVFAYGSLVDPASASRTLGRPVRRTLPARLPGWRRRWSTARDNRRSEKTFARTGDGWLPDVVLTLNLEPVTLPPPSRPAGAPNGALVEVTEDELQRLDQRELRYHRVDVTDAVLAPGAEQVDRVVAYTARDEHHAPSPPEGAVVLAAYVVAVETAFDALAPGGLDTYRSTTGPPPVLVIDAGLVQGRVPDGNPVTW